MIKLNDKTDISDSFFQSLLCSFGRDTFVAAVDDVCVGVLQLAQGRGVIQRGGKHLRITENKAIKKR